jgi:leucyl-tRNA synthetase
MQRNWIGRSEGAEIEFRVEELAEGTITVFTTRPDTLFGATYLVLAPEHPLVQSITTMPHREKVEAYVAATARRSERDRQAEAAEGVKTGEFTGAYAVHPVSGARVPIWISDYVLASYGTGAIMAVPGHDERDHAFATAMGLPIVEVVAGGDGSIEDAAFTGEGLAVNSDFLDGLRTPEAKAKMIEWLETHARGRRRVTYKLRDWLFSRQRYWGEPFPLVHRRAGVTEAVTDLPVTLPPLADFNPSETGEPPLAKAKEWRELPDGSLREANTMPQWAGSCWYYLRFCDPSNGDLPWSQDAERYWMPVDLYVGGAEHAVLHLLYARFWHKVLFDLGHVHTREPFKRLVHQGMVLGATYFPLDKRRDEAGKAIVFRPDEVEADGDRFVHKVTREPVVVQWDKMSKSRGNVVNPDEVVRQYGADTMRLYEMFMGPLEHSAPWQPDGVVGCHKFLQRAHRLFFREEEGGDVAREIVAGEGTDRQRRLLHQTIDAVTDRVERLAFNTAISALMVCVRDLVIEGEPLPRDAAEQFVLLLSPFAPHLAEELWREALGKSTTLAYEPWPAADPASLVAETWTVVVQVAGKRRADVELPHSVPQDDQDAVLLRALAIETVTKFLLRDADGTPKPPRRVIYVPGKILNLVP